MSIAVVDWIPGKADEPKAGLRSFYGLCYGADLEKDLRTGK